MNGPSETVAAAAADIRAALDSGELWPLGVLRARELDPDSPHSHEPGAAVLAAPRRPTQPPPSPHGCAPSPQPSTRPTAPDTPTRPGPARTVPLSRHIEPPGTPPRPSHPPAASVAP
ncbi:hypothetical protein [Candidatus Poriferisodalis sp.]|uniref:hypothetical protein n=1 Tax=Candidatus Poriferisodalis sp. TaxID=3101277 RepID=UPI003B5949E8